MARTKVTREQIVQYVEATLVNGYTKKDAYLEFIDNSVANPSVAVANLEKKKEFKEIFQVIYSDDNAKIQEQVRRVRGKYADLVEKNIDRMSSILDSVKGESIKSQAVAVRLANETISAMSVVSGGGGQDTQTPVKRIDKSGVIS